MKKIIFHSALSILIVLSFSCGNKSGSTSSSQSDSASEASADVKTDAKKKYEIKSGIVTYKSEVMGMTNSQILYFDDYGAKEATHTITELSMMGQTTRKVDVIITKDGYRYTFELENKMNGKDEAKKEVKKESVSPTALTGTSYDFTAMTDELKKEYQYKDEGKETVAGVEGNKFSMVVGKAKITGVMYNNIMLKTAMDMITITAEKFEKDVDVPADKFEYPADYKVIEAK